MIGQQLCFCEPLLKWPSQNDLLWGEGVGGWTEWVDDMQFLALPMQLTFLGTPDLMKPVRLESTLLVQMWN